MNESRESEERVFAERFRQAYRRTPLPDSSARSRILDTSSAAARAEPEAKGLPFRAWLAPRRLAVSPIAAATVALALFASGAVVGSRLWNRLPPMKDDARSIGFADAREVQFVLVARSATSVAVVGDFNGWDSSATPMRRDAATDAWSVVIPLDPGWHAYAFIVDGGRWVLDPRAPIAPADDFGARRSVVVVGERGT